MSLDTAMQPVFSQVFGCGSRNVLAAHCGLAHSGAWRGLAQQLAEESSFTAFDLLSHGKSPDWDGRGDYQDCNVEAGLTMLQAPADLIGHSFGATVALRLAVARPELVRSLILIEPVFFAAAIADGSPAVAAMEEEEAPFREAWEAGDAALAARLFNRIWGPGEPKWPDLPEAARAGMTRSIHIIPAARPALHGDRAGLLKPGVLEGLSVSVLLIEGAQSHPVMFDVTRGLQRRMPDARIETVASAGHMVPITHAAEVADLVRDFWNSRSALDARSGGGAPA
jgi:pimeloyl-ACP methyl ester carboxylesterase